MTKMEDKLMFQDMGIQSGQCCWKRLHKEHEISMTDFGFTWFMKAATGKGLEYCKDNHGPLCYWRVIQGHSGGIPKNPELMYYTLILYTDTLTCACAQHTLLHEHITAHSVAQDEGASHVKSPRILIVIHLVLPCRCSTSPSFFFLQNTRPPAPHSPGPQRQLRHTRGVAKQPHKARPLCPIGRLLPARIFSTSFTEELRGIFSALCKWNNTGRKREWQGSTSSLVYNSESTRKRPGREEPHFDYTVPQKVHYQTHWKRKQDAVCWITVIKSAGLKIENLANRISNHHLRHSARRLHWSCDFSERRSSNFRKAHNTMASTQGYVKE